MITPADALAILSVLNGLFISGQKLAVTLGGKELCDEELRDILSNVRLRAEANRDN